VTATGNDNEILIATDGSECSEIAFKHVLDDRSLPVDCEFKVVSVVEGLVTMSPMGVTMTSLC